MSPFPFFANPLALSFFVADSILSLHTTGVKLSIAEERDQRRKIAEKQRS
jgi:hypothetical protein